MALRLRCRERVSAETERQVQGIFIEFKNIARTDTECVYIGVTRALADSDFACPTHMASRDARTRVLVSGTWDPRLTDTEGSARQM
jgi:hypothetical protein